MEEIGLEAKDESLPQLGESTQEDEEVFASK